MCGRFSITGDLDFYAEYFGVDEVITEALEKSWNVAPTDSVYVVSEREGRRRLAAMKWGLVPLWSTDERSIQINARAETVASSPAFRDSFARKRCLIPADGFYEWDSPENGRAPHWVYRADGHPMVFAGIWASKRDRGSDDWIRTCAIITTAAAGVVRPIHDRMPLTVPSQAWDVWLDRDLTDPEAVLGALVPDDPELLMEHLVSRQVNSVKNNGANLREAIEPETLF